MPPTTPCVRKTPTAKLPNAHDWPKDPALNFIDSAPVAAAKEHKAMQKNWLALQKVYSQGEIAYFLDAIDIPFTDIFQDQVMSAYNEFKDTVPTHDFTQ